MTYFRKALAVLLVLVMLTAMLCTVGCGDDVTLGQNVEGTSSASSGNAIGSVRNGSYKVGDALEPYEVTLLSGEVVNTDDLRGSVVMINLWATWCGPCINEMPDIQKLRETYTDEQLVILAVNIGDDVASAQRFAAANPSYTFAMGTEAAGKLSMLSAYIPYTIIADPSGTVVYTHTGAPNDPYNAYKSVIDSALQL